VYVECPIEKREKCTKQYVLNAGKNAKSHLSLIRVDQYIAKNVIVVDDHNDVDIRL
jgi:hypothetical protein